MVGPSPVNIMELEIGDHVKIVSDDGGFEAIIRDASPQEGVTFKLIKEGTDFIIAFDDFPFYDLYPKGETIKKISEKKSFAQKEQLLESSNCSKVAISDITDTEIQFFKSFDQFQNTSLGDAHQAEMLIMEMREILEKSKFAQDLNEAVSWAIEERLSLLTEANMV